MSQNDRIRQAFANLASRDRSTRLSGIYALGRLRVPEAITPLRELLSDADIGGAAANALLEIGAATIWDDGVLFAQPDFNGRTLDLVYADDAITLLRFSDSRDWAYVRTANAVEGWVPVDQVASPSRKKDAKPQRDEDRGPSRGVPSDLLDDLLKDDSDSKSSFAEVEETASIPRPVPPPAPIIRPLEPPGGSAFPPATVEPQAAAQTIQFSAYYPKEVAPNTWLSLRAYIYNIIAAPQVLEDAKQQLGAAISDYRQGSDTARTDIQEGALITATPDLPGFQFNPPTLSLLFLEDWHRFDFKLRASGAPLEQASNGRITFTVEGIIVADIPLSIFVSPTAMPPAAPSGNSSPMIPANTASETAKVYQAIFCSYSHKDTQIIERVERAYKALGLDYLRDVTTLKSGQSWNAELLNMIDRADIFQLFWSENSSKSQYVQQEWEYALQRASGRTAFIRPVYWEQPMPNVPPPLSHVHFAFQPELDD